MRFLLSSSLKQGLCQSVLVLLSVGSPQGLMHSGAISGYVLISILLH